MYELFLSLPPPIAFVHNGNGSFFYTLLNVSKPIFMKFKEFNWN